MGVALAPDRWRRLRPLLDRALDLDDSARRQFLDELSTQSDELRLDLERLIDRHLETAGLSQPAAALAGPALEVTAIHDAPKASPFVGRRVGPFQLVQLLGAGGMGAVYEAHRVEGGFRQTVAIKLVGGIHPGLNARFARERQILAELRHPHIAQLLDGGETADGMPYFALEYIDGRPITEYADAVGADVDGRLRLLIEVAEALAYAHRRDVIHRDIKPNNILVSADGHVKLLDFGIAKLLKGESGPSLTHQRMGPMTPEYAAPEQFRGGELSAATDVYQFGVLLFRMLTGRLPYRASTDDGLAWARAVSEQEPLSLTHALREARRAAGARADSGELTLRRYALRRAADLDAIVRRCLAKEPASRYPGMDALIADLQAYLAPVRPAKAAWRSALAPVALALMALLGYTLLPWPSATPVAGLSSADWSAEPALAAFGLRPENLHAELPGTEGLIRQALTTEARGDAPAALALLASAHRSDRRTPVPALLSAYWMAGLAREEERQYWRGEAQARVAGLGDPYIDLLAQFLDRDIEGGTEQSLRYSGAILEMRPEAWFLRLARAHALNQRNLRAAALKELQAIDVTRLGHRKLVDAIADRGSLGDLRGAWAQYHRLERNLEDPDLAALHARLIYSSGDLPGARDAYLQAVALARADARFDIEARGLLWAGIFSGALGDYSQAQDLLSQARVRLGERQQFAYAADAEMALAQIAALRHDQNALKAHLYSARALLANTRYAAYAALLDLYDARLTGAAISLPESIDSLNNGAYALLQARQALQLGQVDAAKNALERARAEGVGVGPYVEEAALLAQELSAARFELPAIDPPFGPYSRYAARWPLGAGATITPSKWVGPNP